MTLEQANNAGKHYSCSDMEQILYIYFLFPSVFLKLKDQIRQDKREIRSATYKIGEIYRELHSEDYEEAYEDCFQRIECLEQANLVF